MNNNEKHHLKETLSAFMDDEPGQIDDLALPGSIADAQIAERMSEDPDLISTWHSMHLVRDVMQGDYHSALPTNFAAMVSESIAQEDAHQEDAHEVNVVSISDARSRIVHRNTEQKSRLASSQQPFTFWKPVAGLGLAASLAGASFLFSQLWLTEQQNSQPTAQQNVAQAEQTANDAVIASTQLENETTDFEALTLQTAGRIGNGGTRWRMDTELPRNQKIENRLNMLLTNHLEEASMGRVHGLVSHSRIVGYDSMPDEQSTNENAE